jgi:hypothetical protein
MSDFSALETTYTHKLMRTKVLRQIPLLYTASLIARNELPLVWVDADVIDWLIQKPIRRRSLNTKQVDLTRCTVVIITVQMCAPVKIGLYLKNRGSFQSEPEIPYFDSTVFAPGDKPFAFAVERHGSDI